MSGVIRDKQGAEYRVRRFGVANQLFCVYNHQGQVAYALAELDFSNVNDVLVDEELRRRGIATALYDYIEREVGHKLRPSRVRYADGREFWKAREAQK
jgi:GNAT superfamily N-acetyltransferase